MEKNIYCRELDLWLESQTLYSLNPDNKTCLIGSIEQSEKSLFNVITPSHSMVYYDLEAMDKKYINKIKEHINDILTNLLGVSDDEARTLVSSLPEVSSIDNKVNSGGFLANHRKLTKEFYFRYIGGLCILKLKDIQIMGKNPNWEIDLNLSLLILFGLRKLLNRDDEKYLRKIDINDKINYYHIVKWITANNILNILNMPNKKNEQNKQNLNRVVDSNDQYFTNENNYKHSDDDNIFNYSDDENNNNASEKDYIQYTVNTDYIREKLLWKKEYECFSRPLMELIAGFIPNSKDAQVDMATCYCLYSMCEYLKYDAATLEDGLNGKHFINLNTIQKMYKLHRHLHGISGRSVTFDEAKQLLFPSDDTEEIRNTKLNKILDTKEEKVKKEKKVKKKNNDTKLIQKYFGKSLSTSEMIEQYKKAVLDLGDKYPNDKPWVSHHELHSFENLIKNLKSFQSEKVDGIVNKLEEKYYKLDKDSTIHSIGAERFFCLALKNCLGSSNIDLFDLSKYFDNNNLRIITELKKLFLVPHGNPQGKIKVLTYKFGFEELEAFNQSEHIIKKGPEVCQVVIKLLDHIKKINDSLTVKSTGMKDIKK